MLRILLILSKFSICWDKLRFVKKSQLYQDFLSLKMTKSLDVLRNLAKIPLLLDPDWDKLSRNVKFPALLISIETFGSGHWCRDEIEKSWSRLRLLRQFVWWCQDWDSQLRPQAWAFWQVWQVFWKLLNTCASSNFTRLVNFIFCPTANLQQACGSAGMQADRQTNFRLF